MDAEGSGTDDESVAVADQSRQDKLSALSTGADGVSGLPDRKELPFERQQHRHSSEQIKHAESLPRGHRTYQSKVWIDGFSGNGLTSQLDVVWLVKLFLFGAGQSGL